MADDTKKPDPAEESADDTKKPDPAEESADDTKKPDPEADLPEGVRGVLAKERKAARDAQKTAADLAKRIKEFEDRDKSQAEKDAERLTAAEKKAEDAELRALRLEVAAEKGLKPSQAKRLVGTTREELEADADEIVADFGQPDAKGKPAGDIDQGNRGTSRPAQITKEQLKTMSPEEIVAAKKEGRCDDLLGITT